MKTPCSRNGLMLAIVSREEAEGESKMMGSFEREGLGGFGVGMAGIEGFGRCGRDLTGGVEEAGGLVVRSRVMKSSACLRTWEKSCVC